ncbi:MAG TPA: NAD(P)/FAD-dependent oxidoreductase [Mycobacteriales bacterium]|nr:NAD(P)/FAD-dependent oxidoreductase [Mycobacteriales bacterium]
MTILQSPLTTATAVFSAWLERFGTALEGGDTAGAGNCFVADGYWRDILAFTWSYRTFAGPAGIAQALGNVLADVQPHSFRVSPDRLAPRRMRRSAREVVEGYFDFETKLGRGAGFVRLVLNETTPEDSKAWLFLTTMQELRGHEEAVGDHRPTGVEHSTNFAGPNWLDQRIESSKFSDRDRPVLIVGGGQSGLALGARLRAFGVDALIVEKNDRIGDNWRNRYHSLTLHNEVWANGLPYMPFPPTWPTFLPKDKLAGWLEGYAEAMELNVWTGTELIGAAFDQEAQTWTVQLKQSDGAQRELRVRHVVLATGGVSGVPNLPSLPGLDIFDGEVIHSGGFGSGIPYQGKRAIVIGTGNSGHDVAQDLHDNGAADVTIVQRSPTCVVSLVPSGTMVYAVYSEGPAEDIDLITAAIPYPVLQETYQWLTKKTCSLDRDLLDRLEAVGFEIDMGPDDTGFHMKYLRQGGGYYINVGCSDLIAEGKVHLLHARDIAEFTPGGLRLADGRIIASDLVVLATGYENLQEGIRRIFGSDVADKVGPVWGFDSDGFLKNMWTRTPQPSFWIMGGALMECRLWSRFLALQIKADLEGIATTPCLN